MFGGTVVGTGGVLTQTQLGVGQSCGLAGAVGQHGCAEVLAPDIEAQATIGVRSRNNNVTIAKPNFVLVVMSSGSYPCTWLTNSLIPKTGAIKMDGAARARLRLGYLTQVAAFSAASRYHLPVSALIFPLRSLNP